MVKLDEEIAKTIFGMKRVIARDEDSSDSEESYLQSSNRGNKLKRKANYIQDGQYGRARGPKIYKASVEHAGYHRNILQRNPKRYDQDGIELSDSDEDEEADAQAAEDNPYAEIRLENLLLPLVSAASLPEHPSLSFAYTSPMLTNMAQHAYEMVQRERKSINSAKQMLTKFRADETWIPCGLLYSEEDEKIFDTTKLYPNTAFGSTSQGSHVYAAPGTMNGSMSSDSSLECRNGSKTGMELGSANEIANASHYEPAAKSSSDAKYTSTNGVIRSDTSIREALPDTFRKGKGKENHVVMAHSKEPQIAKQEPTSEDLDEADKIMEDEIFKIVGPEVSVTGQTESEYPVNPGRAFLPETGVNGADSTEVRRQKASEGIEIESGSTAGVRDAPEANKEEDEVVEKDSESRPPPRRMRTRAQAQAASEPTASSRTETPDAWVPPEIHPLFMIPASAIPDKDYGLPPSEAEDTRRLLMAYVQKQEEVVRGAEKLYEGLMQAERQRRTVFRWCKAEGHVGEMSDGEDWYNKDEWGLEDNLRKGHNDDEEDTAVAGKKIRGRRV